MEVRGDGSSLHFGFQNLIIGKENYLTIFHQLSAYELCTASRVCRFWNSLANEEKLWEKLARQQWPTSLDFSPSSVRWKKVYTQNLHYKSKSFFEIVKNNRSHQIYAAHNQSLFHWDLNSLASSTHEERHSPRLYYEYQVIKTDHPLAITCLSIKLAQSNHENCQLITGSVDGTIKIWNSFMPSGRTAAANPIQTLRFHKSCITALLYLPGIIVSASSSGSIYLQTSENETILCKDDGVEVTALQPGKQRENDHSTFYSGDVNQVICLWEITAKRVVNSLQSIKIGPELRHFITLPAAGLLLAVFNDHTIHIWLESDLRQNQSPSSSIIHAIAASKLYRLNGDEVASMDTKEQNLYIWKIAHEGKTWKQKAIFTDFNMKLQQIQTTTHPHSSSIKHFFLLSDNNTLYQYLQQSKKRHGSNWVTSG